MNDDWLFRPRDEYDVDVHPDTVRGQVLALYDEVETVTRTLNRTWRGRVLLRMANLYVSIKHKLRP